MGDMREYFEPYKEMHKQRVAKTPARLEYAKKMLNENNITYKVCNEQTGQINCFLSNGQIMIFYAGTGKIKGYEHARGIHNFVKLCQRKELSHAENGRN